MLDKKFIAYLISDIIISLLLTILLTDIIILLKILVQNWTAYLIILFSFFCFIISICLPWIYKQLLKEKNGIYD